MKHLEITNFERAEYDGQKLLLHTTDKSGKSVAIAMALPQYAALTMDVGFAISNHEPSHRSSKSPGQPVELSLIEATAIGLTLESLQNAPVLVFRHGQGRQSAFLVPRKDARQLAEKLVTMLEASEPAVLPKAN